jgi:hypothetical protein
MIRFLLDHARRSWRSPLLLPLALFLVALAAALRSGLRETEGIFLYALDDAYIHMAVAKNLATHGVWGCTPWHFSSSSSSLLWTLGLGLAYVALQVHDWIPFAVNLVLAVGTLVVAERSLSRLGVAPVVRGTTLLGIVVAFPMVGMVLMGMEHVAHLLLTIAFAGVAVGVLSGLEEETGRRRHTVTLCVLGALLAASRYEGLFLVGLVCLAFLVRRQLPRAFSIGAAAILPVAAFGVLSVAHGWYFLPNPLMVKAVDERASTLTMLLKPFGSEDLAFLQNNPAMPILLVLGIVGAALQWRARRDVWSPRVLFPLLLVAMVLLHGHFVFSPLYWAYRYDAYLVAFGLFVAPVVMVGLPTPRGLPRWALPALLVFGLVPVIADVREGVLARAEIAEMRNTYLMHYQTAQFINSYYPDDTVIVNDLGAVTYYTEARILDLVGLGDIEPVRIMRSGPYTSRDVTAWTAPYDPEIAIVQLGWAVVRPLVPPEWVNIAELTVPPNRHRVGFFVVNPEDGWALRGSVDQHFGPLVRRLRYRLRLKRTERMPSAPGMAPEGGETESTEAAASAQPAAPDR